MSGLQIGTSIFFSDLKKIFAILIHSGRRINSGGDIQTVVEVLQKNIKPWDRIKSF